LATRRSKKNASQKCRKFQKSGAHRFVCQPQHAGGAAIDNARNRPDKGRVRFNGPTEEAVECHAGIARTDSQVSFPSKNCPKSIAEQSKSVCFIPVRPRTPVFSPEEIFHFVAKSARMRMCPKSFQHDRFHDGRRACGHLFRRGTSRFRCGEEVEFEISIPNPRFAPGHYAAACPSAKAIIRTAQVDFDTVLDLLAFEVRPEEGDDGTVANWSRGWVGHFTGLGISPGSSSIRFNGSRKQRKCFRKFRLIFMKMIDHWPS